MTLAGEGAYAGLTAQVFTDGQAETFEALLFEGELPAVPPTPTQQRAEALPGGLVGPRHVCRLAQ